MMSVPYMYIHAQFGYSVESIYRRLMSQSDASLGIYPDTFPNNIADHFWIQEGQGSIKPWISIGRLMSGLYFYYTAFSTRKDGKFYVNTVSETVTVETPAFTLPQPSQIIKPPAPTDYYSKMAMAANANIKPISLPAFNTDATTTTYTVAKSIKPIISGHMNLWLSSRYSDLIQFAMDSQTYQKYLSETSPFTE